MLGEIAKYRGQGSGFGAECTEIMTNLSGDSRALYADRCCRRLDILSLMFSGVDIKLKQNTL
ncbi:hypothetical protein GCM10009100_22740 [Thalassospira tepidiphila]